MERITGGNGRCLLLLLALFVSMSAFASSQSSTSIYTLCPTVTGYYRSLLMVMDGSDGNKFPELAPAQNACNQQANCYGIGALKNATEFYLKTSAVMPTRIESGSCLYTKITPVFTSCPSAPNGYSVVYDVVPTGAVLDTTYTNVADATIACNGLEACASVSAEGATTFKLYDDVASTYKRFSCVYVKVATSCTSYPGYTVKPDYAVTSQYRTAASGDAAYFNCRNSEMCMGLDSNGRQFSREYGYLDYSRGSCGHVKALSTSCPTIPGFNTYTDQDYGNTGTTISAADDATAAAACVAEPTCRGWSKMQSSTGVVYTWRKRAYTDNFIYKYGSCFYAR